MRCLCVVLLFLISGSAHAGVMDYVRGYNLGFDYTNTNDRVRATYETSYSGSTTDSCDRIDADTQSCSVTMSGGNSSGWGVFLQQPFKRQGQFYLAFDVGFGLRMLSGASNSLDESNSIDRGLPFRSMKFQLLALVAKPYMQIGITPASTWPDILLSIGPSAQIALGQVTLNDERESVAVATASSGLISGFVELEIVLWRFGGGALSIFSSSDVTSSDDGSKLYPKSVDGIDNVRANFNRSVNGGFLLGMGLKILLNWP